ncbi:hypothetical protein ELQ92_13925 [Labedella populi]|uniref:Alcohol dehydrogenase n=1 Tax=Labedella populi TaxID=2498850 RepID=A0A3S4DYV7_9MICO|nr:hypothetical protein [Labedella populi]RWZ59346.1 hypothetical protein ELQ92_13925 [Labedella populi]
MDLQDHRAGKLGPTGVHPQIIDLWRHGSFPLEKLVREYPLSGINQAFEDSRTGLTVKSVAIMPEA